MAKEPPRIIATRGNLRLVHQNRDEQVWPNVSDLTLEELRKDAMGEDHWVYVSSWCLSPRERPKSDSDYAYVALKMLLDPGPVTTQQ